MEAQPHALRALLARLRGFLRGSQQDRDLRDQLRGHLQEATDEYIRQGLPPAEARRAARLDFGSVVATEEACRDVSGRWHHDLAKDVVYGQRMVRRNPGFAIVAVLSLAAGIGANSAIFTILNATLLRPRPFSNPEEIVELYTGERERPYETTSYPSYGEFRDRNGVFIGLAAYGIRQFILGDPHQVEQIWGEAVSANYFEVLGIVPQQGRAFLDEEDAVPGRNPVAVISHGLWKRRFNADVDVVGRSVTINGQQLTVIGIAPLQYTGAIRGLASEVWVPINMMPALEPGRRGAAMLTRLSRWLTLVGRLPPEATIEQARARFDVLSREMQAAHPEEWRSVEARGSVRELFVSVLPERDTRVHPGMVSGAYAIAALLVVVINLVLAIACINLANMLLARSVARRKEFAVRLALGAGRLRLIRQLLAECVLLSLVAGAFGIVLAAWWLELLLAFMPPLPEGIRVAVDLRLDWRVVAYAVGFSTATGILFGLAPALQSSRTELSAVLKDESGVGGDRRKSRIRGGLVVSQVALSLFLLIAAGLMLRSLEKVRPTRLGFISENVLVASLTLDDARYDRPKSQEFYRRVSERLLSLSGVQAVSFVEGMPGGFMSRSRRSIEIEGYEARPGESLELDAVVVGPRYFNNLKIPLVQGRDFDERDRDGAPCAAIVNEAFARRFFANSSALGKRLTKSAAAQCEIVGVARDDRWQSLNKDIRPFFWLALDQSDRRRMFVLLHTTNDPAHHAAQVRQVVQGLDPRMPVNDIQTLPEYFDTAAYPFHLLGVVLGGSGLLALLIATIGIYGIVSYAVAQRTREVGIRIALGALRSDILKMVVGHGMLLVAMGLGIGLLLSFALTRVLTSSLFETELLFGVSATDSLTFSGVTLLLALVALVACSVPAYRATTVDPVEALRYE